MRKKIKFHERNVFIKMHADGINYSLAYCCIVVFHMLDVSEREHSHVNKVHCVIYGLSLCMWSRVGSNGQCEKSAEEPYCIVRC